MSLVSDTHGRVLERLSAINREQYPPEETALIILGDSGINFYLNKTDARNKKIINERGFMIYCVRGNHEERPENIATMQIVYDDNVVGKVYYEPEYPNIRYFMDGKDYVINGHRTLVIGGAYSVDKWYRLSRAPANATWTGWFKDEQLSDWEVQAIAYNCFGKDYDFVFTHACPISWEPTDLFLGCVDQSTVDKSTEMFLDKVRCEVNWKIWCFGHYHADRLERPRVEQFYTDWENVDAIWNRWYDEKTIDTEWWLQKSPNYYMTDDET